MATGTGKRPKAVVVKKAAIENTSTFLQQLPEKQKEDLSLKETIAILCDPLKAALAKGYTYPELAAMLSEKGIKISAFTLKNYVPAGKRRTAKEQSSKASSRGSKQATKDAAPLASTKLNLADSKSSTSSRKPKAGIKATAEATNKSTAQSTKGATAGRRTTAAAKADSGATVKQTTTKSSTAKTTAAKTTAAKTTAAKKTTDAKSSRSTLAKPSPTRSKKAKP